MMRPVIAALAALAMLAAATAGRTDTDAPSQASISNDALQQRIEASEPGFVVLDVRTPEEYAEGHVPGAINMPHDTVSQHLSALSDARDKEIIVYCRSGRRAAIAIDALREAGFAHVTHLEGDMLGWEAAQLPVEMQPDPGAQAPTEQPAER
jgi:phage shock protein E